MKFDFLETILSLRTIIYDSISSIERIFGFPIFFLNKAGLIHMVCIRPSLHGNCNKLKVSKFQNEFMKSYFGRNDDFINSF